MKLLSLFPLVFLLVHIDSTAQIIAAKPTVATTKINEIKAPTEKPVAFRLSPFTYPVALPANASSANGTVLNLSVKQFDLGNNTSGNSFIAPENGVYHFDVRVNISYPISDYQDYLRFHLMLNKNGQAIEKTTFMNPATDKSPSHTLSISTTIMLNKGDAINASYNADANSAGKNASSSDISFSGFKVSGMGGAAAGGTIR
jgi:hypothetical protein